MLAFLFFSPPFVIGDSLIEWLTLFSIVALGIGAWDKVNCHEHGCPRISWHKDKDGHPICKVHHPDHPAEAWFKSDKSHPRHRLNKNRV